MQFFATIYKVWGRVSYYIVPLEFQCIVVIGFRAIKLENLVVGILGSKDSHDFPPAMPYAKIERGNSTYFSAHTVNHGPYRNC